MSGIGVTNSRPAANPDADLLYLCEESTGLAYNLGTTFSYGPPMVRAVKYGGVSASANDGLAAFWGPDGTGQLSGAYPVTAQLLAGNTRIAPRGDPTAPGGRVYRHPALQVPIGYDGEVTAEPNGLSALPYALQASCTTVVAKQGSAGIYQFAFGFENSNAGNFWSNSQGAIGFFVTSPGASGALDRVNLRGSANIGPQIQDILLPTPIDISTRPVKLEWRVTWGRTWTAELFVDDALIFGVDPALMAYADLNLLIGPDGYMAVPHLYQGDSIIRGPYYSRAEVRRIAL